MKEMEFKDINKDIEWLKRRNLSIDDCIRIIAARQAIVSQTGLKHRVNEALYHLQTTPGFEKTEIGFYLVQTNASRSDQTPQIMKEAVMPRTSMENFKDNLNSKELEFISREYLVIPTNHSGYLIINNHRGLSEGVLNFLDTYTQFNLTTTVKNALAYEENFKNATTDELTGVSNRRFFNEIFKRHYLSEKRRKGPKGYCVIMIDIDNFKQFNDKAGHQGGDAVLTELAGYMNKNVRGVDTFARYGGEEFILLLTDTTPEEGIEKADWLRKGIKGLDFPEERRIMSSGDVTVTMGVAHSKDNDYSKDADAGIGHIIGCADKALYVGKEGGRNRVVLYDKDIHSSIQSRK